MLHGYQDLVGKAQLMMKAQLVMKAQLMMKVQLKRKVQSKALCTFEATPAVGDAIRPAAGQGFFAGRQAH